MKVTIVSINSVLFTADNIRNLYIIQIIMSSFDKF